MAQKIRTELEVKDSGSKVVKNFGNTVEREFNSISNTANKMTRNLNSSLNTTNNSFSKLTKSANLFKAGIAVAAGTAGMGYLVKQSLNTADSISKVADKLGLTTKALQEYRYGAEIAGVAQQALDMGLQRFTRRLAEASQGTGELKDILKQYDIAVTDSNGNVRDTGEVLKDLADAIATAATDSEALRIAFKAFDSEGVAMVNMLRNGSAGILEFQQRANELGIIIDNSLIQKAVEAKDRMTELTMVLSTAKDKILLELSPSIIEMSEAFTRFIVENKDQLIEFGKNFATVIGVLAKNLDIIIKVLGTLLAMKVANSLMAIGSSFMTLQRSASDVKQVFGGVMKVMGETKGAASLLRLELGFLSTSIAGVLGTGGATIVSGAGGYFLGSWLNDMIEKSKTATKIFQMLIHAIDVYVNMVVQTLKSVTTLVSNKFKRMLYDIRVDWEEFKSWIAGESDEELAQRLGKIPYQPSMDETVNSIKDSYARAWEELAQKRRDILSQIDADFAEVPQKVRMPIVRPEAGPIAKPTPPAPGKEDKETEEYIEERVRQLEQLQEIRRQHSNTIIGIEQGQMAQELALAKEDYEKQVALLKKLNTNETTLKQDLLRAETIFRNNKMEIVKKYSELEQKEHTEALNESLKASEEYAQKELEILEKQKEQWEAFGKTIIDSVGSALTGVLDGTKSWADAMLQILEVVLQEILKVATTQISTSITSNVGGGGGGGGLFGSLLGGVGDWFGGLFDFGGGDLWMGPDTMLGLGFKDGGITPRIPGAEDGNIFNGPQSGYPVMMHGNEAVIPLKNGAVPVQMYGGGGAQVNNFNVTVNNTGQGSGKGGDDDSMRQAKDIRYQLELMIEDKLKKERRPMGLLNNPTMRTA